MGAGKVDVLISATRRLEGVSRLGVAALLLAACTFLPSGCGKLLPVTVTSVDAGEGAGAGDSSAPPSNGVDGQVPGEDSAISPPDASAPDAESLDSSADAITPPLEADAATFDADADAMTTPPVEDAAADADAALGLDSGLDSSLADGPLSSFPNAVPIDVSSLFNANTIFTTAEGGVPLTPVDGPSPMMGDDNDFPTATAALSLNATGTGLPDDAFFPSKTTTVPNVQLSWTNAANVLNSLLTSATAVYSIPVPPANYGHAQLYAFSTNGGLTLAYTLVYADASSTGGQISLPDWCHGTLTSGEYVLASAYRAVGGTSLDLTYICNLYAVDLSPDPAKALAQIRLQITMQLQPTTTLVLYGATAW